MNWEHCSVRHPAHQFFWKVRKREKSKQSDFWHLEECGFNSFNVIRSRPWINLSDKKKLSPKPLTLNLKSEPWPPDRSLAWPRKGSGLNLILLEKVWDSAAHSGLDCPGIVAGQGLPGKEAQTIAPSNLSLARFTFSIFLLKQPEKIGACPDFSSCRCCYWESKLLLCLTGTNVYWHLCEARYHRWFGEVSPSDSLLLFYPWLVHGCIIISAITRIRPSGSREIYPD